MKPMCPRLAVVVDTEEEFDWCKPFARGATSVSAMHELGRFQTVCDAVGARPAYVVDYPVASQAAGYEFLKEVAHTGRAEVGAHLHPWVTPPFDESLTVRNSFPGNLPAALERAKLVATVTAIEANVGVRPRIYKAGRYGFGPNTAAILTELGFAIDTSFSPPFDWSDEGGPDYSARTAEPFWFGAPGESLLELPATGAFVGFLGGWSAPIHRLANRRAFRGFRAAAVLSRIRAVDRLFLSPEGFSLEELQRLTRSLLQSGTRVFTFSLHSPSLKPGCTPYVDTERELDRFLDRCRRYFEFFVEEIRGAFCTPGEALEELRSNLAGA